MAKYDPDVHPAKARECCNDGATLTELAKHFGVSRRTVCRWLNEHPDFLAAVRSGREVADELVEHALFRRAVGFEYTETEVTEEQTTMTGVGEGLEIAERPAVRTRTKKTKKTAVPDTTALEFWLTNRKPEEWKRKQEITGKDGGPMEVSIPALEELLRLDADELARLHSEALAQSGPPQRE